jgi:osmotically-inducible protein OsmY
MTDQQLHEEILAELAFEPEVHPERIGVSVEHGVVTLSGHVDSYSQKLAAERVVKRVYSAKAVVDDLEVRLPGRDEVPDTELAEAAIRAIEGLSQIPRDSVRITVRDGHLSLEGKVEWQYQRRAVENAIRHLRGVRGVRNHIALTQPAASKEVQQEIVAALRRSAEVEGAGITVESFQGKVTLHGTVSSLREWEAAERAAWRAVGVTEVENRLVIVP